MSVKLPAAQPLKTYPYLDLVRFLAACGVMLYHLVLLRNGALPGLHDTLRNFWHFGWTGVEIFFTLSGFVIAFTADASSPSRFLVNRIVRLAPTIWVCATITVLATLLFDRSAKVAELMSAYCWTIVMLPTGHHVDLVYWTLTVEISFYALVFFVLWIGKIDRLVPVIIAVGAASTLYNFVLCLSEFTQATIVNLVLTSARHHMSKLLLLRHGCFFALGVLLWNAIGQFRTKYVSSLIVLFFLGGTAEVWYTTFEKATLVNGDEFSPLVAWCIGFLLILLARRSDLARINLGLRWTRRFRFIGLLTFPIYLIHNRAGLAFDEFLTSHGLGAPEALAVTVIAVIGCSIISVAFVDPLIGRRLKSVFGYLMLPRNETIKSARRVAD